MSRARTKPSTGRRVLLSIALMLLCTVGGVSTEFEFVKNDHLEGPNVCKEVENITETITTPREEAYQERYNKWCLGIPPRCSAYKIKVRTVNETRTIIKQRIVKKCCVGYELDTDRAHCVPECKAGCRNGQCVEPNVCRCDQGYAGKTCNIKCPPNRWGSDCSQRCLCRNEAVCNAADGSCTCTRGFKGQYCELTCSSNRYGQDCAEICQCQNGGKCDHVSGECYCAAGFTGPLCTESCPAGTHGAQCQSKCRCQNGGTCDPVNGECICPAGYTGMVCANRCQPGRYGLQCANRCECFNGADCDRVTGQCICAPGFMGAKCLDSCSGNQYGINCTETCRCLNGAPCDTADGRCTCPDGWTGADCGQRICPKDRYGANCTGICECDWNNTNMCHPWTGKCLCKPGWSNSACERPCRFLRYGQDCQLTCNCKNSSPCSHIDGTCMCIAGFKGESCEEPCSNNTYGQNCSEQCQCMNGAICEGETGKCVCAPGWQGIKCDRPCDPQHFGRDCTHECRCQNGGVCNPIDGRCTCPAGWTGEQCEKKCTPGRFGQNCEQVCDCHLENTLACNATTGRCICKADWGGVRCESRCALGYFGENCNEVCTCHNNSSCDPMTGNCICSSGWTGPNCDEPCPKGFFGHGCMERCPGSTEHNRTCNHITGRYSCPPGYIGPTCGHPCSSGFYGQDCQQRCSCKNGAECSHVTGQCQCTPGWTGLRCETVCEDLFYGTNCSQRCNCHNNAKCRKNDGTCICEAGWMGHRCDEVCPDGFYGNHCMNPCECPSNGNFVCHAAKGCVCMIGFTGKNCDERLTHRHVQENETASEGNMSPYVKNGTDVKDTMGTSSPARPPHLYSIRIDLLNASDGHNHDREHRIIVEGGQSRPNVPASYNVTVAFSVLGNSFLRVYNRTHSLRPGQQVTLLHREGGFLDLTLAQMNSYVTLSESAGGSSNFMETFVNSTTYRVASEETLPVNVSYENLQERIGDEGDGNRTISLLVDQKMVIRLVSRNAEADNRSDGTGVSTEQSTPGTRDAITESLDLEPTSPGWLSDEVTSTYQMSIGIEEDNKREHSTEDVILSVTSSTRDWEQSTEYAFDGDVREDVEESDGDSSINDAISSVEGLPSFNSSTEESVDPSSGSILPPVDDREQEFFDVWKFVLHQIFNANDGGPDKELENRTDASPVHVDRIASSSGTVWAIVLSILFVSIFIMMLLYYRRRVANLKAEVNHVVNYMTQEQPSHFDNPVYARTGGGANGTANGTLTSNGTVPPLDARTGLLRSALPNNLRDALGARRKENHDKYSYPDNEYGVDKSYSITHYGPESLKNYEADLTNPNCFKDHVYDEIRLKDSIDTDYDHLDYSRPHGSHKAHYFRMSDDGSTNETLPGPASTSGGGSPKAINVLREASGRPINNLSAPLRVNNLLPAIPPLPEAKRTNTDPNLGNDLSSSSNSSPTPPSPPPSQQQRLVGDGDAEDIYLPMTAGVEAGTSSTSSGSDFGGVKIPDHQLNIKE